MPSTASPCANDGESGNGNHRSKHRREIKRYHQREHNRHLRSAARSRDDLLFLFDRCYDTHAPHDDASRLSSLVQTGTLRSSLPCGGPAASTSSPSEKVPHHPQASPLCSEMEQKLRLCSGAAFQSIWNFDFLLRDAKATAAAPATPSSPSSSGRDGSGPKGPTTADHQSPSTAAAQPPNGVLCSTLHRQGCASSPVAPSSLVHAAPKPMAGGAAVEGLWWSASRPPLASGAAAGSLVALPITTTTSAAAKGKLRCKMHVQRVEGVPAMPVEAPLPPGTDLNLVPRNYLTLDPVFNLHQHAPGFRRSHGVALRSMFANVVIDWRDMHQNALVLSSAEAMRAVFEQAYSPDRTLALQIRRMGPTVVIDRCAETPTRVADMRRRSLLGKALYTMKDSLTRATLHRDGGSQLNGRTKEEQEQVEEEKCTMVAVAERRALCKAMRSNDPVLHRYSHVLRWDIGTMEVLVGLDTPILLDRRTNCEHIIRIEDDTLHRSAEVMQQETLRCWFDAMLANVSQVGTYYLHDGVVQSFRQTKVQELLGLVEGRMATAALNFTTSVLQWITQQCLRDGATYAVVRGFGSQYVELFELPDAPDGCEMVHEAAAAANEAVQPGGGDDKDAGRRGGEVSGASDCGLLGAEFARRFCMNFGRTCFGIAQHFFREGDNEKANDALTLLLRSADVFVPRVTTDATAHEVVGELAQMVPVLIARKIQADTAAIAAAASGGADRCAPLSPYRNQLTSVSLSPLFSPELYRDALLLCGCFVALLQEQEIPHAELPVQMRHLHARSFLLIGAAVCVVVARALEAYNCGRHHIRCGRDHAGADGGRGPLEDCTRDLLHVVLEGLARLEELSKVTKHLIAGMNATPKSDAAGTGHGGTAHRTAAEQKGGGGGDSSSPSSPRSSESASSSPCTASTTAIVDPRTSVDLTPLCSALFELYGDVVLVTMADAGTGTTAATLQLLSKLMTDRYRGEGEGPLPSTLQWVSTLTTDVVSLSFTALRFYSRISTQTRRHLVKLAHLYYLVGKEHHRTDRYTKALEALHRCKSLLTASEKAPEDGVFGAALGTSWMVKWHEVMQLLGEVYMHMMQRKMESSRGAVTLERAQPLVLGELHLLPEDADTFFHQALDAYTNCGAQPVAHQLKAFTLLLYVEVLMERVALTRKPPPRSCMANMLQLLREAQDLNPCAWEQPRRWLQLRLLCIADPPTADADLVRSVEEHILNRLDELNLSPTTAAAPAAAAVAVVVGSDGGGATAEKAGGAETHAGAATLSNGAEQRRRCDRAAAMEAASGDAALRGCNLLFVSPGIPAVAALQLACGCGSMVERLSATLPADMKYRMLLRWAGRAAIFLVDAMDQLLKETNGSMVVGGTKAANQWQAVLRSWGESSVASWMYHMTATIAHRFLVAMRVCLHGQRQREAQGVATYVVKALDEPVPMEKASQMLLEMQSQLQVLKKW